MLGLYALSDLPHLVKLEDRVDPAELRKHVHVHLTENEFLDLGVELIDVPGLDENDKIDELVNSAIEHCDIVLYTMAVDRDVTSRVC